MAADMALLAATGIAGTAGTMLLGGFLPNQWPFAGIVALLLCVASGVGLGVLADILPDEPIEND